MDSLSSTLSKVDGSRRVFSVLLMVSVHPQLRRNHAPPAARDNKHFVVVCPPFFGSCLYGAGACTVEVYRQTALWYHTGLPAVPLRFLLIRDPKGRFAPQALLTTDVTLSPRQMRTYFRQRWAVETTFEQARAHLGMETQRQWNELAIARTTPVILALFSLVTLIAHQVSQKQPHPGHTTAWYPKPKPTFADALAGVRQRLWQTFSTSANQHDLMKIPQTLFNRLIHTGCYAT